MYDCGVLCVFAWNVDNSSRLWDQSLARSFTYTPDVIIIPSLATALDFRFFFQGDFLPADWKINTWDSRLLENWLSGAASHTIKFNFLIIFSEETASWRGFCSGRLLSDKQQRRLRNSQQLHALAKWAVTRVVAAHTHSKHHLSWVQLLILFWWSVKLESCISVFAYFWEKKISCLTSKYFLPEESWSNKSGFMDLRNVWLNNRLIRLCLQLFKMKYYLFNTWKSKSKKLKESDLSTASVIHFNFANSIITPIQCSCIRRFLSL